MAEIHELNKAIDELRRVTNEPDEIFVQLINEALRETNHDYKDAARYIGYVVNFVTHGCTFSHAAMSAKHYYHVQRHHYNDRHLGRWEPRWAPFVPLNIEFAIDQEADKYMRIANEVEQSAMQYANSHRVSFSEAIHRTSERRQKESGDELERFLEGFRRKE